MWVRVSERGLFCWTCGDFSQETEEGPFGGISRTLGPEQGSHPCIGQGDQPSPCAQDGRGPEKPLNPEQAGQLVPLEHCNRQKVPPVTSTTLRLDHGLHVPWLIEAEAPGCPPQMTLWNVLPQIIITLPLVAPSSGF